MNTAIFAVQRRACILRMSLVCGLFTGLTACTFDAAEVLDRRPDYRTSQVADPLEIPPDLTSSTIDDTLVVPELDPSGSATLSAYTNERGGDRVVASEAVLQEPLGMSLQRDGDRRWLLVDQPPSRVWPAIKAFWTTNGFVLEQEDPRIGIMETDWAENRADIPGGVIRSLLGNVSDFTHSAATRDRFRVRLERVDGGTEVFLVHYGMEEVLVGEPGGPGANNPRTSGVAKWRPRPSDPELEAEMLRRLMVYLGADERRAGPQLVATAGVDAALPQPRIQRTTAPNGQAALLIEENYAQAWRLVGLALDRSNYPVEDQNRSQGLYVVGYQNLSGQSGEQDRGLLGNLAFWRGDEPADASSRHQVRLAGQGSQTLVVVQDAQGQPDQSSEAMRLLDALGEAIN